MLHSSVSSNPVARASEGNLENKLDDFLSLSRDLLSLVEHENAILLEDGALSFEAYIMRKVNLMNRFENEARNLLGLISKEQEAASMQNILIAEIRRMREALNINSGFQIRTMMKNRRERLSKCENLEIENSGDTKCH